MSSFNVGWFLSTAGLDFVGRGLIGTHRACLLECATRSDARAVGRRAELGISDSGWAACSHPCADCVLGTFSGDYVQAFSSARTTVGRELWKETNMARSVVMNFMKQQGFTPEPP